MKYEKNSIDYVVNLEALKEMELIVPMTLPERRSIRKWVYKGNDLESNPWHLKDGLDFELNYLQAFRIVNGYPSGPWDSWTGSSSNPIWDDVQKCFYSKDEI